MPWMWVYPWHLATVGLPEDCVDDEKVMHGRDSEKEQKIVITFEHSLFCYDSIPDFVILFHISTEVSSHK